VVLHGADLVEQSERFSGGPRLNFLFTGGEEPGHNLAVLYTLVATCEKHGVNPIDYITDVLTRVQTHPARDVAELLPHRWKPPDHEP
jgi:transposase